MKLLRALSVALGAVALLSLAWIFIRRVGWPYDLEWMEGGVLCQALRIKAHEPIYAAPSIDFIPFLYTPFYPAIVSLMRCGGPEDRGGTWHRNRQAHCFRFRASQNPAEGSSVQNRTTAENG